MDILEKEDPKKEGILILGCGYVGGYFLKKNPQSYFTTRHRNKNGPQNPQEIYFNLEDESSWQNIPKTKNVLWTFSAASNENEAEKAIQFYKQSLIHSNVIVLSSTSAYVHTFENEFINVYIH